MRHAIRHTDRDPVGDGQRWNRSCAPTLPPLGTGRCRDGQCDDRGERRADRRGAPARPRRRHQPDRPFRAGDAPCLRRRLGLARGTAAVQDRSAGREAAHHHHAQRIRPTFPSTARSIPIAAASMAASTALRGRRTAIWACRRGSISNRSCSPSRMRRGCSTRSLSKEGYQPRTIAIGTNTDPYQPIEKQYRIMREILEVLEARSHPVGIVTKSALVARDIDILSRMAERGLAKVALSVTTLDRMLARTMEPRAATPTRRLEAIRQLDRGRHPDLGHGGADHSGPHRPGDRAHPRFGRAMPARARPATSSCACRWKSARSSRTGCCAIIRTATGTSCRWSARCATARTTIRNGASG